MQGNETTILEKVGYAVSSINDAKNVNDVICALYSLALLLFPVDSSIISGCISEGYRDQVRKANVPSSHERSNCWNVFYRGAAFPTTARVLLYDVASNWLACFPLSAQKHVYDVFFVKGLATEFVQNVVPCLQQKESDSLDMSAVYSNAERLLVLCLLENGGVLQMAREYGQSCQSEYFSSEWNKSAASSVAQLVASVPDKARLGGPPSLSSHSFFKQIVIQLLDGAEERTTNPCDEVSVSDKSDMDGTFLFVGGTFARICRRGSADLLLDEMIPRVIKHVQSFLTSNVNSITAAELKSKPGFWFWSMVIEAIKDPYAVERISEQILRQLATKNTSDVEAYWVLWLLYHQIFCQSSMRSMFVDKFLLWKIFPICCLRWILQFAVFECPPQAGFLTKGQNTHVLLDTVPHLAAVWSKREFVQSASMEQQAYVTASLGLCLEKMSKEELDKTKDVMHSILQGVSCRLENPNDLVRKMASSIALVFSKVIDPMNPLYLDDSCKDENLDWEFGLTSPDKVIDKKTSSLALEKGSDSKHSGRIGNSEKRRNKKISEFKLVDPDEIVDPATLNYESTADDYDDDDDDGDNTSENSEASSDSSLQPYDLADNDDDLKKKFSQLVDVVGALRKSDNPDGVEMAIDVAEKLVRASPDELPHIAGDLARTLVQVRCSDLTIEGEEDSAEEKRHKALVALVVTSTFESLDTLNKLLYSPNVDISQRILILDVMTEAAQELSAAKTMKLKHQGRPHISLISDTQPWFLPNSEGPPGAGSWKEVSETGSLLNWTHRYERELPSKQSQIKRGTTRRWSLGSSSILEIEKEWSRNKFPVYAAAFMLPAMQGFDKKRHGVDFLGRDFIVLSKLIYMLGVCMKCAAMHPEASALAPPLLDMLSSREVCHHVEAYVRRSILFAASCILVSLHPTFIASSLAEGNQDISLGLEWIRRYALQIAESDSDKECYAMAIRCLQLHSEMALQASRALESVETALKTKSIGLPSSVLKGTIKIPYAK